MQGSLSVPCCWHVGKHVPSRTEEHVGERQTLRDGQRLPPLAQAPSDAGSQQSPRGSSAGSETQRCGPDELLKMFREACELNGLDLDTVMARGGAQAGRQAAMLAEAVSPLGSDIALDELFSPDSQLPASAAVAGGRRPGPPPLPSPEPSGDGATSAAEESEEEGAAGGLAAPPMASGFAAGLGAPLPDLPPEPAAPGRAAQQGAAVGLSSGLGLDLPDMPPEPAATRKAAQPAVVPEKMQEKKIQELDGPAAKKRRGAASPAEHAGPAEPAGETEPTPAGPVVPTDGVPNSVTHPVEHKRFLRAVAKHHGDPIINTAVSSSKQTLFAEFLQADCDIQAVKAQLEKSTEKACRRPGHLLTRHAAGTLCRSKASVRRSHGHACTEAARRMRHEPISRAAAPQRTTRTRA